MPPAAPFGNDNMGPSILNKGIYQVEYLSEVNKVFTISSLPDPIIPNALDKNVANAVAEAVRQAA